MIVNVDTQAGIAKNDNINGRPGWTACRPAPEKSTVSLAAEVIHKIGHSIEFMRSHLNQPLQVSKLAAVASISSSHFFAMFKRLTGRAPIEFFIGLRMRRACDLLDETSLSVKEVAAALGYDDQFYFSRVFKLATQMPPTQYRVLDAAARSAIKGSLTPAYDPVIGNLGSCQGWTRPVNRRSATPSVVAR
jgi:AraC-like DNA-binding protein